MHHTSDEHSTLQLVEFGSNRSLHREDILKLSEKDGDATGHEQLQENGYAMVSFARKESNRLSLEDYHCLQAYYHRLYETDVDVPNEVQKIKQMKVLGYVYKSRLTGRDNGARIYAYRPDNYDSDDLEDTLDTRSEEHLRAGVIEYFFFHEAKYHINEEAFSTKHCFAFVSWYKNPRLSTDLIETGISERNKPFRTEFEAKSSYSILPVQKLYTPIHFRRTENSNVFIALGLTRNPFR